jgi:hypothetical protein
MHKIFEALECASTFEVLFMTRRCHTSSFYTFQINLFFSFT